MTESEAIKKAIRHFECMKNDAVVVLDSGFGTHPGESDLVYRNRKMYAELAIKALEKQIPKQIVTKVQAEDLKVGHVTFKAGTKTYYCPACNNAITLASSYCGWCGQAVVLGVDK